MSKIVPKNPILKRVLIIIVCIILLCIVTFIVINKLLNQPSLTYVFDSIDSYSDEVLDNYADYISFADKYDIENDLIEKDFENYSYIASFQEYDKCSERKAKKPETINISDSINITYRVYNKCGWCHAKIMLHLIKIDKINNPELPIKYDYIYDKTLDCGNV